MENTRERGTEMSSAWGNVWSNSLLKACLTFNGMWVDRNGIIVGVDLHNWVKFSVFVQGVSSFISPKSTCLCHKMGITLRIRFPGSSSWRFFFTPSCWYIPMCILLLYFLPLAGWHTCILTRGCELVKNCRVVDENHGSL